MPLKALKNSARSASRSKPTMRLKTESATEAPRPATLAARPVGFMKTRSERPSMNWVSRFGASRKSSALRAGRRVEDEQVEAAFAVQLEELLHRHVLLRAGQRVGDLLVDAVVEDAVARLLVGGLAGDQLVEGRLRVEHHRPELALHLDPLLREERRVDLLGLVAELLQAERVGEALRRVDRQHADLQSARRHPDRDRRRGRRLADATGAGADADVLALEDLADVGISPASSPDAVRPRCPSSGSKRKGSVLTGAFDPPPQPGQLGTLGAGAVVLGERRPRRRPDAGVARGGESASCSASSLVKRSG